MFVVLKNKFIVMKFNILKHNNYSVPSHRCVHHFDLVTLIAVVGTYTWVYIACLRVIINTSTKVIKCAATRLITYDKANSNWQIKKRNTRRPMHDFFTAKLKNLHNFPILPSITSFCVLLFSTRVSCINKGRSH